MELREMENLKDESLVQVVLSGDKKSLDILVKRYQDFIYNISLRMFHDPEDALDATQDVLIKIITKLNQFEFKSSFKTWVFRIVKNHFLNRPKSKGEIFIEEIENLRSNLQTAPDTTSDEFVDESMVEEIRILCSHGLLMCLDREQRLIYILSEIFEIDHKEGGSLFKTSPGNYRVKLHRAKKELTQFVSGRCGLIDPNNACRCRKKAKSLIGMGFVDPQKRIFNQDFQVNVNDFLSLNRETLSHRIRIDLKSLYQSNPYQIKKELDSLFPFEQS